MTHPGSPGWFTAEAGFEPRLTAFWVLPTTLCHLFQTQWDQGLPSGQQASPTCRSQKTCIAVAQWEKWHLHPLLTKDFLLPVT